LAEEFWGPAGLCASKNFRIVTNDGQMYFMSKDYPQSKIAPGKRKKLFMRFNLPAYQANKQPILTIVGNSQKIALWKKLCDVQRH
jgi:hypothetical protein